MSSPASRAYGRGVSSPSTGSASDTSHKTNLVNQSMRVSSQGSIEHEFESSCAGNGKKYASVVDESPENVYATGDDKVLPTKLVKMWTEIDPALPRADIETIIQTTFAEFISSVISCPQPWMNANDKSSIIAIEKARITNGGKIPTSWKAAAEQTDHGRKWLKINQEQEALMRAQEHLKKMNADSLIAQAKEAKAADLLHELSTRALKAAEKAKKAASQAKRLAELAAKAKKAAEEAQKKEYEALKEEAKAWIGCKDSRAASCRARLRAAIALFAVKSLEEATNVMPQGKKRKLGG